MGKMEGRGKNLHLWHNPNLDMQAPEAGHRFVPALVSERKPLYDGARKEGSPERRVAA
jgi:hypothetical protein